MLKKLLPIFSIVALLVMAGFGCKGLSTEEQVATKSVALEFWTIFDDVDALQAQINKFKADRPYISINLRQLRIDEFYPRLVEALAEDKGPDIISIRNKWIKGYQSKLSVMPVSVKDTLVKVEKTTMSTKTTALSSNINLPTPLQVDREYVQSVKNDVIVDDNIYGLPMSMDTMAIYYNKDLLDKSGIPEPPKNWEEFQAAVKKMTKYDKKTGAILQSGAALGAGKNVAGFDDLLYILFKQSGISFVNKNGQAVFNGTGGSIPREKPEFLIMNFYTDFANQTRDTYSWSVDAPSALDNFVNGSVGFFFGYGYHYPQIKSRAPQLNFEIMPMLQLNPEQPVNAANYWILSVPEKAKNKNEAWGLVNYLAHSKATKEYLDQTGRPSALRAYIGEQMDKPELAPFVSQVLVAENWYRGKNYDSALNALDSMLREWLVPAPQPDRDAEYKQSILNRAASKVNQTL